MTSSSASLSNPLSPHPDTSRRKLRKIHHDHKADNNIQWKSQSQQRLYSAKLLHALRRTGTAASPPSPSRVRQVADRVLAITAKGRSRWSRAMLTSKRKRKSIVKRQRRVMMNTGSSTRVVGSKRKSNAVQRNAKVLSRLVPGCRKQPLPVVLEEASDYIPALEMQVRVMRALAELLSASSAGSTVAQHSHWLHQLNSTQEDLP